MATTEHNPANDVNVSDLQSATDFTGKSVLVVGQTVEKAEFSALAEEVFRAHFIEVDYNGLRIAPGSTSTSSNLGTDFGSPTAGIDVVDRVFTIKNHGSADLALAQNPVNVSGAGFSVQAQPDQITLSPGDSTSFTIRYAPGQADSGQVTGGVTILSADGVHSPFEFAVSATPGALIRGDGAGGLGFSLCAPDLTAYGFTGMPGYQDKASPNFGNYIAPDGVSVMICRAKMYYKCDGAFSNADAYESAVFSAFGAQAFTAKYADEFVDTAAANAAGYVLPRVFVDGGKEQPYVLEDKYRCSKVAQGVGFIAASVKNGLPLSTASAHNPVGDVTATGGTNNYAACVDAPKGRDGAGDGAKNPNSIFFCETAYIAAWTWQVSMAHYQAIKANAPGATQSNCAWYTEAGEIGPAGCSNNALGDSAHPAVKWESDGYSNCGKTGSAGFGGGAGNAFAASTDIGQDCGKADVKGLMWSVLIGFTYPSDGAQSAPFSPFYVLKESARARDLTSGSGGATDAWGDEASLTSMFEPIQIDQIIPGTTDHPGTGNGWYGYGDGSGGAVFSPDAAGSGRMLTALALPQSAAAESVSGENLYGVDRMYQITPPRRQLCPPAAANWGYGSLAGPGARHFDSARSDSNHSVGFRAACYL